MCWNRYLVRFRFLVTCATSTECSNKIHPHTASDDLGHVLCPLSRARYAISCFCSVDAHCLVFYEQFPQHCTADLHGVTGRQICGTSAIITSGHVLPPTIHLSHIVGSHFQTSKEHLRTKTYVSGRLEILRSNCTLTMHDWGHIPFPHLP
jgi:hypothetical protein